MIADVVFLLDVDSGAAVELTVATPELPDAVARAVYRIVQEGLTNVHKHARGAATDVSVVGDDHSEVEVVVANRRPVAAEPFTGGLPGPNPNDAATDFFDLRYGGSLNAGGTGAVPEPGVWAMMILGFGLAGAAMRRRRAAGPVLG